MMEKSKKLSRQAKEKSAPPNQLYNKSKGTSLGRKHKRRKRPTQNTPTTIKKMVTGSYISKRASLVAQRLKRLPAMWETWVRSLGREDPLENEMVTHSSILAWRIPWMEEPGGLQSMGSQRVGHD